MSDIKKVLVIDDDPSLLKITSIIFRKGGYEVMTCDNGQAGLLKAEQEKPDLIICDLMMPQVNGLQICKKLRSNPETARLPFMILSASGHVENKVKCFQAGADDYVQKPVDPKELLARAAALLARASFVQAAPAPSARVLVVTGAKGGVGASTIASNIGMLLAKENYSVALVEWNQGFGNLRFNLNLSPGKDLGDLLELPPEQIAKRAVNRALTRFTYGLQILTAPDKPTGEVPTAAQALAILRALSADNDYVIFDLSTIVGEHAEAILEEADQIFMVTEPEVWSIGAAKHKMITMKDLGFLGSTSMIILSRAPSASQIGRAMVEQQLNDLGGGQTLGVSVIGFVPPAPEMFQEATRKGTPLVLNNPNVTAARTFAELAGWVKENLSVIK